MRKLRRSVAHANMQRQGIHKPNRKNLDDKRSFFAKHWRDYDEFFRV